MSTTRRRAFLISTLASASVLAASRASAQAAAPKLEETDPQATALGYKQDGSKVDQAKFPAHAAGQVCSGCQFFQGKPTDAMAPCLLFAGKQVAAGGWCSGYNKKA